MLFISQLMGVACATVQQWLETFSEGMAEPFIDPNTQEIEIDEMWHFLDKKKNKRWVWRAVDRATGLTIAWVVGRRDKRTLMRLWKMIEHTQATIYTDDWKVYERVIPKRRHVAGKRHTVQIERSNSNVRHRLARMTRRTKVVTHSMPMLLVSLKLQAMVNDYGLFQVFREIAASTLI